ncbi:carbohydrate binding family 9 domain-containing protein [candidate division KSB1 bacterium]|nr:carbohydrate binding family 9 domain-containing protein [candidate division KSB1 bacterium]
MNKSCVGLIILLFCFGFTVLVTADEFYHPKKITSAIEFDGNPDEPLWDSIEPLPLVMLTPVFGNPPSERSEIRICYDDVCLYISSRNYVSEPEMVQSTTKKRDFFEANTDWFGIILDTFNDNENAVAFFTTPSGLRTDVAVFNDAEGEFPINVSWNAFWDVKTVETTQGWFAEMRIPFSSLRFQEIDGEVTMGFITFRWIAKKSEQVNYPAIDPKWGDWSAWKPSLAKKMVLKNIRGRNPVYLTPYVLGGYGRSYELNDQETTYLRSEAPAHEIGLDLKYSLTSNLTMDITLNTDFAQVEADDEQINLTRFSLFFPEKRQFFQERSSNFDFSLGGNNNLFYSRSIGLCDDKPVRLYGGARLVGRVGCWDLGVMSMQTAAAETLSSENFSVLRLRRQIINPNSYVGSIVTSRLGKDGSYNTAYGIDGIFKLFGADYLRCYWTQTFENGLKNDATSLNPTRVGAEWQRRTLKDLGYTFAFSRTGVDFNPGMGFLEREDYSELKSRLLYGWQPKEPSPLRQHYFFLDGYSIFDNEDQSVQSAEWGPGWNFARRSGAGGQLTARVFREVVDDSISFSDDVCVPPGRYSFYGMQATYYTAPGGNMVAVFALQGGSFYDGWRLSGSIQPLYSFSSDLELSGYYEYNHVVFADRDQRLNAHIVRCRALWMLNTQLSVAAFVQYNSAAHTTMANFRLRYNPREGNDFYLVYDEEVNSNRYRSLPVVPYSTNRTVLLKYTYTFIL